MMHMTFQMEKKEIITSATAHLTIYVDKSQIDQRIKVLKREIMASL